MATFDATTHPLAFAHMEGGVKTVFVVPHTLQFAAISSGDRIEFEDLGSISIGTVRRYETIPALLEAEGFSNVIPEADDAIAAEKMLMTTAEWDARSTKADGVLALRVRWAKRKS
jgi:ASC-1-like (ASCH) protein